MINKLPKRILKPAYRTSYIKPDLPKILLTAAQELGYTKERNRLGKFLQDIESKHLVDKKIVQAANDEFMSLYHEKKKKKFLKSTSQH